MLSCELVRRKVPLSFCGKCVFKCLDLLRWYRVIHRVVRHLDFILIKASLRVLTKAFFLIVVTVSPIALICTSLSLATNVYISATYIFSSSVYRIVYTFFSKNFKASLFRSTFPSNLASGLPSVYASVYVFFADTCLTMCLLPKDFYLGDCFASCLTHHLYLLVSECGDKREFSSGQWSC